MGIAAAVLDDLNERFPLSAPTRVEFGTGGHPRRCVTLAPQNEVDRDIAGGEYADVDLYYNGEGAESYHPRELWHTSLIPDRTDVVYCSHALQCVQPIRVAQTLRYWKTLLRPGGLLWISVPDVRAIAGRLATAQPFEAAHWIDKLYASNGYEGDAHRNGFTELMLLQAFFEAGFTDMLVTKHDALACHDVPEIRVIARKPEKPLAAQAVDMFHSVGAAQCLQ